VSWPRWAKLGGLGGQWRVVLREKSGELGLGWDCECVGEYGVRPRPWDCFIGAAQARARGGLDRALRRARVRVGGTPVCRRGSNTCVRFFCPSSGACSHSSKPTLALVSAKNLFSSL
jgi:hypothetical protein